MRTLRHHLVGLPLQRSAFAALDDALAVLGFADSASGALVLTADGKLQLDDSLLSEVRGAVCSADEDRLAKLSDRVRTATSRLEHATEGTGAAGDPVARILAVGEALRAFIAIPIVGKTVTSALYAQLVSGGFTGWPPAPSPSPGVRLTLDLVDLADACAAAGTPAAAVAQRWPQVPDEVHDLVAAFARRHVGFGPLPWEAKGWDDVSHVASQLGTIAAGVRPPPQPASGSTARFDGSLEAARHDCLAAWLDATERGLVLVRRAFHVGIRPHLTTTAPGCGVQPVELLFATFDELAALPLPADELATRRSEYGRNRAYLDAHAIDVADLERLARAA